MSFVRSSKFRHVFSTAGKSDKCYSGITITKSPHESNMCTVNGKFLAVVLEAQGGGAFVVTPLSNVGRFDINYPKVSGHKGKVLDIAWNPFDDNQIASSSEDCTVKIWDIPDGGLKQTMFEAVMNLSGHLKKVGQVLWHPSASNVLASSAHNTIIIFNTETGEQLNKISCHSEVIFCLSWNYNGSLLATTCKDKKVRVINPRTGEVLSEGPGHEGTKPSRVVFCGTTNKLFTTGVSRITERQYALRDPSNLSKPLTMEKIDNGMGVLFPFWDEGTKMVYVFGKGEVKITLFEVNSESPYVYFLSVQTAAVPYRSAGCMPKRHLDYMHCEVMRFFGLTSKNVVEPLSMKVPRKSEMFQEDIYPPCPSGEAAMTLSEWTSGVDKNPKLVAFSAEGLNETASGPDFQSTVIASAPAPKAVTSVAATVSSTSPSNPMRVEVRRQYSGHSTGSREATSPTSLPEPKTLEEYRKAYREIVQDNFNLYRKAYKELEEENKRLRERLEQ